MSHCDSAAFRAWFAGSVAVDGSGAPLRLFHGTGADIEAFASAELGIFFTEHPATAEAFALGDELDDDGEWPLQGANLVPAYLRLVNPLRLDRAELERLAVEPAVLAQLAESGRDPARLPDDAEDSAEYARELLVAEARRRGHDGIVFEADLLPVSNLLGDWSLQRSFVVFAPEQVKSAIGNCGDYSCCSAALCS